MLLFLIALVVTVPAISFAIFKRSKRPAVSVTIEKGKPFYPKNSVHSPEDMCGVLPEKRMLNFKVRGKNPGTGRSKTIYNFVFPSWKPFPDTVPGIDPPYTFIPDMRPMSDRQFALFERAGISVPDNMSLDDAHVVITHIVADAEERPIRYFEPPLPDEIMEEAARKSLLIPSFLSLEEARLFLDGKPWRRDI